MSQLRPAGLAQAPQQPPYQQLHELLGRGDAALGEAHLQAWQHLSLPEVPSHVRTNIAIKDARGWRREQREITPELLLGHFRGEYALGGIFAETSRVLVIDLDNQSARDGGGPVPLDEDLAPRMRLAEAMAPRGFWVRSSSSHGLHRWVLLEDPVPIPELAELALTRLKTALAQTEGAGLSPFGRAVLEACAPGGVAGFFELLPYQQSGGQGATIRAPFGPGSALLEGDETIEDPGQALARVVAQLRREGFVRLAEAFPGEVKTQLALPGHPREHVLEHPKTTPSPPPRPRDARTRLLYCSRPGLPPGHLQGQSRDLHLRTMEELRVHGQPWRSRSSATFLLALQCKWNGFSEAQAQDDLANWLGQTGAATSREARQSLRGALHKTAQIVSYVYRPDAPRAGSRYKPPGKIRKGDLLQLQEKGLSGGAVALAVRILCFARTNGYTEFKSRQLLCELPTRELGVRTPRQRRQLLELERAGLLRLERERLPKRDEDHPRGPQSARARLFRVLWAFSPYGPQIDSVRPISPAERTQLLTAQRHTPKTCATGMGVMGAAGESESVGVGVVVGRGKSPRPVGAVGAGPPKGDFEEPRPRGCGRTVGGVLRRETSKAVHGASMAPAASIGPSPGRNTQKSWTQKRRYWASPGGGSGGRVRLRPPSKPRQLRLRFARRRAPRETDGSDGGEEPG